MKNLTFLFITLFSFTAVDSATGYAQIPSDVSEAIAERWADFVVHWEAENAEACAGFYFENGVNIPQAWPEKKGRAEIQEFYAFLFSVYKSSTYTHTTHSLHASGNMAIEYGTFTANWITQDDEPFLYEARCMVHWEKADDGLWYIQRLLFNNPQEQE